MSEFTNSTGAYTIQEWYASLEPTRVQRSKKGNSNNARPSWDSLGGEWETIEEEIK